MSNPVSAHVRGSDLTDTSRQSNAFSLTRRRDPVQSGSPTQLWTEGLRVSVLCFQIFQCLRRSYIPADNAISNSELYQIHNLIIEFKVPILSTRCQQTSTFWSDALSSLTFSEDYGQTRSDQYQALILKSMLMTIRSVRLMPSNNTVVTQHFSNLVRWE